MPLRILYQDEAVVAIDKPAGFHVHPPQMDDRRHRVPAAINCLHLLSEQIGRFLYPVHRIDAATSGVVLYALSPEAAAALQAQFARREVSKLYFAIARGWVDPEGVIDSPLDGAESMTRYERVGKLELPVTLGLDPKHPSTRYSLAAISPVSGRTHQIRRHFAHLRHPLVGDTIYGDGKHNRFFRERIRGSGLFLKAYAIRFRHPATKETVSLRSRWNRQWLEAFDLFGICPIRRLAPPEP